MPFWDSLFGKGGNESPLGDAADKYAGQMRDQAARTQQSYQPYLDYGQKGMSSAYDQYGRNINDPNSVQDQVMSGYQQSPYEKYMLDKVTRGINMNAANTGMMGSGAMNTALQEQLAGISGQFMNDYINRGMNSYGQGLQGMGQMGQMGLNATNSMNDQVNQLYNEAAGGELQAARARQDAEAKRGGNIWGALSGIAGGLGNMFGGPVAGAIGNWAGNKVSGWIGNGNNNASTMNV